MKSTTLALILSLLCISHFAHAATAKKSTVTNYDGLSTLTTNDGDDLVSLVITGAPAEHLFNTIKPIDQIGSGGSDRDSEITRYSPAVDCTEATKQDKSVSYRCVYQFRNDGTLIN